MLSVNGHARYAGLAQTSCEKLGTKLTDSSWWVRANAARALSRAGNSGIGVLVRASENTDRFARDAAVAALVMAPLGGEARLAIKKKIEDIANQERTERPAARPGGLFA
jgi:hypothetical protein